MSMQRKKRAHTGVIATVALTMTITGVVASDAEREGINPYQNQDEVGVEQKGEVFFFPRIDDGGSSRTSLFESRSNWRMPIGGALDRGSTLDVTPAECAKLEGTPNCCGCIPVG